MNESKSKHVRYEYCHQEDVKIVKYLMLKNAWDLTNGNLIWQRMEKSKVCPDRTFHSLRNRYLRNIKKRLKTDFKHIIDQPSQNREDCRSRKSHSLKSLNNIDCASRGASKILSPKETRRILTPKVTGNYDEPVFNWEEPKIPNCNNDFIEEINQAISRTPPIRICTNIIDKNMQKETHSLSSLKKFKKMNPIVLLQPVSKNMDEDGWLSTQDKPALDKRNVKKRLYSSQLQCDINLDGSSNPEVDDSESIYFSNACVRNKICLGTQNNHSPPKDNIAESRSPLKQPSINETQNAVHTMDNPSNEVNKPCVNAKNNDLLSTDKLKSPSSNTLERSPYKSPVRSQNCSDVDNIVRILESPCEKENGQTSPCKNYGETQEVIDITDNTTSISNLDKNAGCINPSQQSTPPVATKTNNSPQIDLFVENILPPIEPELLDNDKSTPSDLINSTESQSFVSCIGPHLEYLGLVPKKPNKETRKNNTRPSQENNEKTESSSSKNLRKTKKILSVKPIENHNIAPTSKQKKTFNVNSKLSKHKLLSQRIVELQQLIQSLGNNRGKRHQRQLTSLAQYILNKDKNNKKKEPEIQHISGQNSRATVKTSSKPSSSFKVVFPVATSTPSEGSEEANNYNYPSL